MPTALITGANRGLGLEFVRQYRADGWDVIATARTPSPELEALGARIEPLDMGDFDAVAEFRARIAGPLDLLVANAGTYGSRAVRSGDDARAWAETFAVNSIAPFLLAEAVLPAVRAAKGKLIAVSTQMASIADNRAGGFIAYRSSKAALNAAWKSLAIDNPTVVCALLHPGWVRTRMGGESAPLSPENSIAGMRRVIEGLGQKESGGFFAYTGAVVPW